MSKLKDGREEVILDPDLVIIDTHQHLFVRPNLTYLFDDYLEDLNAGHRIVASVYVETQAMARTTGPAWLRPLGEVEFANGVAAMSASGLFGPGRVAAAIVGYADLRLGDRAGELLDRALAAAPDRYRGVRQIAMEHSDPAVLRFLGNPPPAGLLENPDFERGFGQLGPRGLSFEATVFHHQLPAVGRLAARHPDTLIVLSHMGLALGMDLDAPARAGVFEVWRRAMRDLAAHPNVVCKIGGLGTVYWGFGFDSRPGSTGYLELADAWAPYVEAAIGAFGVDRCMMESDFPADGRSCGFVPLWNAMKYITRGWSSGERNSLFHGTAARVYHLDLDAFGARYEAAGS